MPTYTREIDHRCAVYARLDEDGTFSVTVRGQSSWREGANASAEIVVDPRRADAIQEALQGALDQHHEAVAHAADAAAMKARADEAERGMTYEELGEKLLAQGSNLDVGAGQ